MKPFVLSMLASLLALNVVSAQNPQFALAKCDVAGNITFDSIRLSQAVLADGKPLAAGTYEVRLITEHPTPAPGQSPNGECWVEFSQSGDVVGREVATVIPAEGIAQVAKVPGPKLNESCIDALKGGEYIHVWINTHGRNYILNMPVAH